MKSAFEKILAGYSKFKEKYAAGDNSTMQRLAYQGQKPETMVVACCDSRVDPALILQCDPGDLFIVRNVANIVPPYQKDDGMHGVSAALEFGVCYLNIKNIIILGHTQCGGINAMLNAESLDQNDFITDWMSSINMNAEPTMEVDDCAKKALTYSQKNCMTYPWIKERVEQNKLAVHLWFFDIKQGEILTNSNDSHDFKPLS